MNATDVVAHPLLEDVHKELAVLFAADRAFGDQVAGLRIEQALGAGAVAPAQIGDLQCLRGGALDDRDELDPLGLHLVRKTVNFDEPSVLHFYFGDRRGSPGSMITFFVHEK